MPGSDKISKVILSFHHKPYSLQPYHKTIMPVPKLIKSKTDLNNFNSISLLNTMSKIFEKLILTQMNETLDFLKDSIIVNLDLESWTPSTTSF